MLTKYVQVVIIFSNQWFPSQDPPLVFIWQCIMPCVSTFTVHSMHIFASLTIRCSYHLNNLLINFLVQSFNNNINTPIFHEYNCLNRSLLCSLIVSEESLTPFPMRCFSPYILLYKKKTVHISTGKKRCRSKTHQSHTPLCHKIKSSSLGGE